MGKSVSFVFVHVAWGQTGLLLALSANLNQWHIQFSVFSTFCLFIIAIYQCKK